MLDCDHDIMALFLKHGALQFDTREQFSKWLMSQASLQTLFKAIMLGRTAALQLLLNHFKHQGFDNELDRPIFFSFAAVMNENFAILLLQGGHNPLQSKASFKHTADMGYIRLVRFWIEFNPLLLQEEWLVEKRFPNRLTQHEDFVSWLVKERSQPPQLTTLCRSAIIAQLGIKYIQKIDRLPLPKALKRFLCIAQLVYDE